MGRSEWKRVGWMERVDGKGGEKKGSVEEWIARDEWRMFGWGGVDGRVEWGGVGGCGRVDGKG